MNGQRPVCPAREGCVSPAGDNGGGGSADSPVELAARIARLVEERGWNREEFARRAGLNRQTVRHIFAPSPGRRRLRNATIRACARALGLMVNELRQWPLERLLAQVHDSGPGDSQPDQHKLFEQATQPELMAWLERHPARARQLSAEEIDELLSLQGTGGPLTAFGVEHFVELLERKRRLLEKIHAVAGTEYLDLLEQFVELLYEKVQPFAQRREPERANGYGDRTAL